MLFSPAPGDGSLSWAGEDLPFSFLPIALFFHLSSVRTPQFKANGQNGTANDRLALPFRRVEKGLLNGPYGLFIKTGPGRFDCFHGDGTAAFIDGYAQHHGGFLSQLPGQSRVFGQALMSEPGTVGNAKFRIDRAPSMPPVEPFPQSPSGARAAIAGLPRSRRGN